MKKLLSIILSIALIFTLIPVFAQPNQVSANTINNFYFAFPNESRDKSSARVVSTDKVTLSGSLNGVVGSSISYKIYQVPATGGETETNPTQYNKDNALNQTQDITLNIAVEGNRITLTDIPLFPGMNMIEFTGRIGAGNRSEVIFIEYRNSPMLTDLKFLYRANNTEYESNEDNPILIPRHTSNNPEDRLTITGKAPNASQVKVIFNNIEHSQPVVSNNSFVFSFGNLELRPGVNTAEFKIITPTQELVQKKQIVLYSQNPIIYNQNYNIFKAVTNAGIVTATENNFSPYNSSVDILVGATDDYLRYESNIIIPKPFYPGSPTAIGTGLTDDAAILAKLTTDDNTDPTNVIQRSLRYGLTTTSTSNTVPATIDASDIKLTKVSSNETYVEFAVEVNILKTRLALEGQFDETIRLTRELEMNGSVFRDTSSLKLLNGGKMYIADVNYLTGYSSTLVKEGTTLKSIVPINNQAASRLKTMEAANIGSAGAEVFSVPFMVELLVGSFDSTLTGAALLDELEIRSGTTNVSAKILLVENVSGSTTTESLYSDTVTPLIDGKRQQLTKVLLEISNLRVAGSNNVTFKFTDAKYNTDIKQYRFNLKSGPYVRFDTVVNNMNIEYYAQNATNNKIIKDLGFLKGQLYNLPNSSEIVFKYKRTADRGSSNTTHGTVTAASLQEQTVFLYLNNVEVPLVNAEAGSNLSFDLYGIDGTNNITTDSVGIALDNVLGALNRGGNNILKFVVNSKTYSFTSTYNFTIMPKDLPQIPAEGGADVYPYYESFQWPPRYNSSDYELVGTTYTTKRGKTNVFGSFNLINLAEVPGGSANVSSNGYDWVEEKVTALRGSGLANYKLVIANPLWEDDFEWTLGDTFYVVDKDMKIIDQNGGKHSDIQSITDHAIRIPAEVPAVGAIPDMTPVPMPAAGVQIHVMYNVDENHFYFVIMDQTMPEDNSPLVVSLTAYNAGLGGPRATYRLEINPVAVPFDRHLPEDEVKIINANYVEVVLSAPGADTVVINKQPAERIKFTSYTNNSNPNGIEVDAFRVLVKDLKAGKDTDIPIVITRAGITTSSSFKIKYVPTTIPGAEHLETMKNSHKVFEGALNLKFDRNTNLIRTTAGAQNVDRPSTQVYNSHDILFSIAHPTDGIVNRHLHQPSVGNYNPQFDGEEIVFNKFQVYAEKFIKASQVFWLDVGFADDPNTDAFDPITNGLDPFPFPHRQGITDYAVNKRSLLQNREIVPSKAGELTLQYDSNIVSSASTSVTVFRFDSITNQWENMGGVVDSKKGTITIPFTKFGYYVVAKLTRGYNDITFHPYARDAMETVYAKGIMNAAVSGSQFGGDQYVTRGEFARMIVKALDLRLNYEGPRHFDYYNKTITDANTPAESLFDYRYIETAARAGIVNGRSPGFFDELGTLTRQEAAVILARALELKIETNSEKVKKEIAKAFLDAGDIDIYAAGSVLAMQKKVYIKGIQINPNDPKEGSVYQPHARMLRSDASIIIARVMIDLKKLPQIFF